MHFIIHFLIFLRQEAVDMLTDLAARKLCSDSPCTPPRHGGRDVTDAGTQYVDTGNLALLTLSLVRLGLGLKSMTNQLSAKP